MAQLTPQASELLQKALEWVDCLRDVRAALAEKLTSHQLTDAMPDRAPWKFSGSA